MGIIDKLIGFIKKPKEFEHINIEQIIAGAFLKFKELDNLDICLLVEKFENMSYVIIDGFFKVDGISQYLNINPNGKITLKSDDLLANEGIKDYFMHIAGSTVTKYFKNFSRVLYLEEKEKSIEIEKIRLLKDAKVLLISDDERDYKGLIDYGFQNVDYFKSIIRADNYFKTHFEELRKYHIILQGSKCINCMSGCNIELEEDIAYLDNKWILTANLRRPADSKRLAIRLKDKHLWRDWEVRDYKYRHIIDAIIENAIINKVIEKQKNIQEYLPIKDFVNEEKLPVPKNKEELKILFLESGYSIDGLSEKIKKEHGIDVMFKDDDNYALGRHVVRNLGNYDIIIASHMYSRSIVHMSGESIEQCKDTGRRLTLLLANEYDGTGLYNDEGHWDRNGIGNHLRLDYSFGGSLAPINKSCSQEFNVLIGNREDSFDFWCSEKEKMIVATIHGAIDIYNQALVSLERETIVNDKTIADYTLEYNDAVKHYEEEKEKILEPVKTVNNMIFMIKQYLYYKRVGAISTDLEDLKITEGFGSICVERILNGRVLCSIVIKDDVTRKDLNIFSISTLNKKGVLGGAQLVGVYTKKYENRKKIPKRASEEQMQVIRSMAKKIEEVLEPLNSMATSKCAKKRLDAQKLSRKKPTKKGNN